MNLLDYSQIDSAAKNNLLLGNGFSIGISPNFSYSSLLSVGQRNKFLDDTVSKLFDELETSNFEYILEQLSITERMNRLLGVDFTKPNSYYVGIRDALISCVKEVHPDFSIIDADWSKSLSEELRNYREVFTTNYDSLLYWVAANNNFSGFTDFFWSSGMTFDQFNTEIWGNKTSIIYLHGALFLHQDSSAIRKIRSTSNLLQAIEDSLLQNRIPVFVSEGSSNEKYKAISRNPYLTFAFRKFQRIQTGLTIFGHSLSQHDQHIVDKLNNNKKIQKIAYAVHTGDGKSTEDIQEDIDTTKHKLRQFTRRGGTLQFFDSSTSPLYYPAKLRFSF